MSSNLEIKEGGVRLPASKLEGAKEYADADTDAIGEEECLAEVADGVRDARLVGAVIARRRIELVVVVVVVVVLSGGGAALAELKLVDGVAEALLRLTKAAVGVGFVGEGRRGRRGRCHGMEMKKEK